MITVRHSRRSFLRLGAGATAAVGLGPFIGGSSLTRAATTPKRIVFCIGMHGFVHENLEMVPGGSAAGDAFEYDLSGATLSPILKPLAAYQDRLLVLDGVSMNSAIADYWNAKNPHVPAHIHLLTGANTAATDNFGAGGAASVDQIIADRFVNEVPFRSVEVGFSTSGGGLGLGAYNWSAPSVALPYLYEPAALFDYLFDAFESPTDNAGNARQERVARFATDEHTALLAQHTGASADRLTAHRDLLASLADRFDALGSISCDPPTRPSEGTSYAQRYADHASVIAAAFACDLTRVATIAFEDQDPADCGGEPTGSLHNDYAHDTKDRNPQGGSEEANTVMTNAAVNHGDTVASLLTALDAQKDGDGTSLLDNTIVVWTSELACGRHNGSMAYSDLPFIIAGGGNALKLGRYVSFAESHATPYSEVDGPAPTNVGPSHNQLWVSLCHAMGLTDVNSVGVESIKLTDNSTLDCTGPLPGLT